MTSSGPVHLLDGGGLTAARQSVDAGRHDEAAQRLASLPPQLMPDLDPHQLGGVVAALDDGIVRRHPRVLVALADAYALSGHTEQYVATLERARVAVADRAEDDAARLDVVAAELAMRAAVSDDDTTAEESRTLLARPDLPPMARARVEAALGRALATRRRPQALRTAGQHLRGAAQQFEQLGASGQATTAHLLRAIVSSWPLGHFDTAADDLQRALDATGGRLRARVAVLPFLAFVLIDAGRYREAEAALSELRVAAREVGDERGAAYARWAMARMASQRGDAAGTLAACRTVSRASVTVDTGGGAFFHADAAQLLARAGHHGEARQFLGEARRLDPGGTPLVATAELAVAVHVGDLDDAWAALQRLDEGERVEPRDRWRVTLLHAHAARRAGDPQATALAAAAFEEAAQLGRPDLPLVREPALAADLLPLAVQTSPEAAQLAGPADVQLRTMGAVEVVEAEEHRPVTGRPAELLTFLALHGPVQPAEAAIEALWPDCHPDRGRQRLRTVLARTRRDVGDVIERVDSTLRLRPHVEVDVHEFERLSGRALNGAEGADRVADARAALALHHDLVAPGLNHLDWVMGPRVRLRERALALRDWLADRAEEQDQPGDAVRELLAAIDLDPVGEHRYLRAARVLAAQGHRARALELLDRACATLDTFDLPASRDLHRLHAYLARGAGTSDGDAGVS